MSEELQDEITSINSIYGQDTLTTLPQEPHVYALTVPTLSDISFRVEFPLDYPDAPPSLLGTQSVGTHREKGEGAAIVESMRTILSEIYVPGSPCIFDLVEEAGQRLQHFDTGRSSTDEKAPNGHAHGQDIDLEHESDVASDIHQPAHELSNPPPWIVSEVITEKKSIFVARAAQVESVDQAKSFLSHLLATDKKVAKATHNITAWRIRGENSVQYQDCDDDGETAAGGRVLHLLELMNVWNAMVVVTRWYGGVQLGPDRFRIINQCARDAVVKVDFGAQEETKDHGKRKGKK